MERKQLKYTPLQALEKAKYYCAYQVRCHQEVKDKLYSFGLHRDEVDELLVKLIEENYLNEERFAVQFAGGKFRMNKWGKVKIVQALRQKRISEYLIRLAIKEIDRDAYLKTLSRLAEEKWKSVHTTSVYAKEARTTAFLMQKGFELEIIREEISRLKKE